MAKLKAYYINPIIKVILIYIVLIIRSQYEKAIEWSLEESKLFIFYETDGWM